MPKKMPPPPPEIRYFQAQEAAKSISLLTRRHEEVDALRTLRYDDGRVYTAAERISDTILQFFGANSPEYDRHQHYRINTRMILGASESQEQHWFLEGIDRTLHLLDSLVETVKERTLDAPPEEAKDNVGQGDPKRVFIVYGRNSKAHDAMRLFVRSLKLEPLSFDEVRNSFGGSPFVGNIVRAGMTKARGIVVLLTPDEYAHLRPSLFSPDDKDSEKARRQPRPNVLLEAGMALALDESRTILVILGKGVELASDLHGRHCIRLSNDPQLRDKLRDALVGVGCTIDQKTTEHNDLGVAGDFESCVSSSVLPETIEKSPFSA